MNHKCLGATKNITFKFNSYIKEKIDKKDTDLTSEVENIDNIFVKNISDTDSESTTDSNRPSFIEKYENCNKILDNLEKQCI